MRYVAVAENGSDRKAPRGRVSFSLTVGLGGCAREYVGISVGPAA
jgi:hypothetical protein